MVPMHHAEDMAAHLPQSGLYRLQNTGHFSILRHFGLMLDTLLSE